MTQVFDKPVQDALSKEWMRQNPTGFYLNQAERAGEAILHRVGCPCLREDTNSTTYDKIAAATREELIDEAGRRKLTARNRSHCKPEGAD